MGLMELPAEVLVSIISDYAIPIDWNYYSEGQSVLNMRLVCSKLFIMSFHFAISQLNSSVFSRNV
jgi:hypothetical protein